MYHCTTADRLESIRRRGLRVDSPRGLTLDGQWAHRFYGCAPVFLTEMPHAGYREHAPVLLGVDVDARHLVADLPALTHHGAYYDEHAGILWWDSKTGVPPGLTAEIFIEDLLVPESPLTLAAIRLTASAASLANIPPLRIRRL